MQFVEASIATIATGESNCRCTGKSDKRLFHNFTP
jgi:hypothetical protein